MTDLSEVVIVNTGFGPFPFVHVKCCRVWLIAVGYTPSPCGICRTRRFVRCTQAEADAYETARQD